jgi:hypothetical protein
MPRGGRVRKRHFSAKQEIGWSEASAASSVLAFSLREWPEAFCAAEWTKHRVSCYSPRSRQGGERKPISGAQHRRPQIGMPLTTSGGSSGAEYQCAFPRREDQPGATDYDCARCVELSAAGV